MPAERSLASTDGMVTQISTELEQAIQESHKVEQVNELTDEILSIIFTIFCTRIYKAFIISKNGCINII